MEEFVRDQLPRRRGEIERVDRVLFDVAKTFEHFAISRGDEIEWPYAVFNDDPPKADRDRSKYSFSTQAMVLFALRSLTSRTDRPQSIGLVSPRFARCALEDLASIKIPRTDIETVTARLQELADKTESTLLQRLRGKKKTRSSTFGENDVFTLTWLLEGLNEGKRVPMGKCVSENLRNPQDARMGDNAENNAAAHAFILLRTLHAYAALQDKGLIRTARLEATKDWFHDRLHLHLSYSMIQDSSFDAPELVFALEGLLACDSNREAFSSLVQRTFDVIRQKQETNPNLRPYRPIVSDRRGKSLLPLTIEVFSSLLRVLDREENRIGGMGEIRLMRPIFERYTEWLLGQLHRIYLPDSPDGAQGWHSEHTQTTSCVHVWETSQVLIFLMHYRTWLHWQLEEETLTFANFTRARPKPRSFMPTSLAQCSAREFDRNAPVYLPLMKSFVVPRQSDSLPAAEKRFSVMLYGPPGTGKTTLAEFVAGRLDWELLTVTLSDFLVRGDQMVETRAKAIFEAISVLRDKVILFDELDRLILDRDTVQYKEQGDMFQFMTPSMLPKLQRLRELEACIFILATNYEERIDSAAKRKGRIDERILVPLPDIRARKRILSAKLEKLLGSKPPMTELNKTAKQTAFYNVKELDELVVYCQRETWPELKAALEAESEQRRPDVTADSYADRAKTRPYPSKLEIEMATRLCSEAGIPIPADLKSRLTA